MDFVIRFCQSHETFRVPEIKALATLEGIVLQIREYREESPFCLVTLPSEEAAKRLVKRAILVQAIYEHWGDAKSVEELLEVTRAGEKYKRPQFRECSFRFVFDSFHGTRPVEERLPIIHSFSFMGFKGKVTVGGNADEEFAILEEWEWPGQTRKAPMRVHFGRLVALGARHLAVTYDLKKRKYISTTSMDSELALITANMALADHGKLFYDPFVGTGSFPIACAHFGAYTMGSDIDGRCARGKAKDRNIKTNFEQYGLLGRLGSMFAADLTNSPLHVPTKARLLDGIVCDPPYGLREGLKVLGNRDSERKDKRQATGLDETGNEWWKNSKYVPPKKPYSFAAMLDDILDFAAATLVDGGRLAFWMPTANEDAEEISAPTHPCLDIVAISTQEFTKWSRKLITYQRLPDSQAKQGAKERELGEAAKGVTANDLNPFRRKFFAGFQS